MSDSFRFLPVFVLALSGVLLAGEVSAQGHPKSDASYEVTIPEGKLVAAVDRLRAQSGVQIMYETSLGEVKVPALKGKYTVRAALAQLLANTGIRVEGVDEKTVVLKRVTPVSSNVSPADQMRVVLAGTAK